MCLQITVLTDNNSFKTIHSWGCKNLHFNNRVSSFVPLFDRLLKTPWHKQRKKEKKRLKTLFLNHLQTFTKQSCILVPFYVNKYFVTLCASDNIFTICRYLNSSLFFIINCSKDTEVKVCVIFLLKFKKSSFQISKFLKYGGKKPNQTRNAIIMKFCINVKKFI